MKNYHTKQNILTLAALIGAVFVVLTGCGEESLVKDTNTTILDSVFAEADKSKDTGIEAIPRCKPGILPDQNGYAVGSVKKAFFYGEDANVLFQLRDASTGEVAYEGKLIAAGTGKSGSEYTYIGDFSEWDNPGTYYLTSEKLGESPEFCVSDDIYEDFLNRMVNSFTLHRCGMEIADAKAERDNHPACHLEMYKVADGTEKDISGGWHTDSLENKSSIDGSIAILYLLAAYELQPEVFTCTEESNGDNVIPDVLNEAAYEMKWLFKLQEESGMVSEGVSRVYQTDNPVATDPSNPEVLPVSVEATYVFAAAAAEFGRIYRNYDADYAAECVYAAELAYQAVESDGSIEEYIASAQLYKTTGKIEYRTRTEQLLKEDGVIGNPCEETSLILGDIAYLSVPKNADAALCAVRMDFLAENAKNILEEAQELPRGVAADESESIVCDILKECESVAYMNSVITNRDYRRVLEEELHYLGGRNREAVNFIGSHGVVLSADQDFDLIDNARLVFILGLYQ